MSIEPNKRTFFNNDNLGAMLSSGDCSGKPGVASTDNNDISSFFSDVQADKKGRLAEEAKVVNAKKRLRLSIC